MLALASLKLNRSRNVWQVLAAVKPAFAMLSKEIFAASNLSNSSAKYGLATRVIMSLVVSQLELVASERHTSTKFNNDLTLSC